MSRVQEMQGFLPDDYVERKAQFRANILWAMIFVIVAGGIGTAFFIAEKKVSDAEAANRLVKQQFEAAAKPIEEFGRIQQEHERLKRQAELAYSLVERVNRSNVLAELTNCLPKGVFLVDLGLEGKPSSEGSTPVPAQKNTALVAAKPILFDVTMRIKGLAVDSDRGGYDRAAAYAQALGKSPLFLEPKMLNITDITYKERKMRSFEYEIALNPLADSHTLVQSTASAEQSR